MPVVGWPAPFFVFSGAGFNHNNNKLIAAKHITNNEKGNTMKCDPTMEYHCQKVLAGEYEIKGLPEIKDPVVVDIGANAGAYALWAAERYKPKEILCYEPNPDSFGLLRENTDNFINIIPANLAVSWRFESCANTLKGLMHLGKNNTGECSFYKGEEQSDEIIEVKVCSYRTLPLDADILKIDIEHGEDALLEKLLGHMPNLKGIALEWHSAEAGLKCLDLLGGDIDDGKIRTPRGILTAYKKSGKWIVSARSTYSERLNKYVPEPGKIEMQKDYEERRKTETFGVKIPANYSDYSDLYIGIPVHYQPTCKFSMSCMALKEKCGNAKWEFLQGDAHPDRARNRIVANFLKSDCQYLLFLDADLQFDPEQILSLYHRGKDMICGFYAAKRPGKARWIANAKTDDEDEDGLVELWEGGTGIMLIHRRVIEAIIKAYPDCEYTTDPGGKETQHAVFSSGPVFDPRCRRRRWLSEDWMFCLRAIKCGFTIYGDPRVVALHEGTCMFPTEFNEGELRHE